MKIEIAKEIRGDASLTVAVGRINSILGEIVANVSDHVAARWELAGDLKARILFLNLWYEDQAAGTTIDPKELENPARLRSKLRDVWGDLLEVRLHTLVAGLKTSVSEEVAQ